MMDLPVFNYALKQIQGSIDWIFQTCGQAAPASPEQGLGGMATTGRQLAEDSRNDG